jgi:hypothetical protein
LVHEYYQNSYSQVLVVFIKNTNGIFEVRLFFFALFVGTVSSFRLGEGGPGGAGLFAKAEELNNHAGAEGQQGVVPQGPMFSDTEQTGMGSKWQRVVCKTTEAPMKYRERFWGGVGQALATNKIRQRRINTCTAMKRVFMSEWGTGGLLSSSVLVLVLLLLLLLLGVVMMYLFVRGYYLYSPLVLTLIKFVLACWDR